MKIKRFDFNFKPLQVQQSISVESSVPAEQTYNADTNEYVPDYTFVGLTLQPNVSILDKDNILDSGSVTSQLTNICWYENIGGTERLIDTSEDTDYTISTEADTLGQLVCNKNARPKRPIRLKFTADYIDPRNGQVMHIIMEQSVRCRDVSEELKVEIDAPSVQRYDPLSDADTQTITPTAYIGSSYPQPENYRYVWRMSKDGESWHDVGTDAIADIGLTVNDGESITIDRTLMGDGVVLRCYVLYTSDPTETELVDLQILKSTPYAEVRLVRHIPRYDVDMVDVPTYLSPDTTEIYPTAVVTNSKGIVQNFAKVLIPKWYTAQNNTSGAITYDWVASGASPRIILPDYARSENGKNFLMALDVEEAAPLGIAVDSDGSYLVDENGDYLII